LRADWSYAEERLKPYSLRVVSAQSEQETANLAGLDALRKPGKEGSSLTKLQRPALLAARRYGNMRRV
jgi:hypothetical protein